jgi:DNA-binding NtrC family response regulator
MEKQMKRALPPLLIVDDERNMRISLQTVLSDEGYEVIAEASAETLTRRWRIRKFMIITDAAGGDERL